MKTVELYARVRHAVLIEGISERAAADRFGINARTVSKMLKFSVPPGYVRTKAPFRPKLYAFTGVIDAILAGDKDRPKKQRHTSKRIFERLQDEYGFMGRPTIVKDYVAGWRRRTQEVFVPLVHPPGHAQADFGEAIGVIGGIECKIHFFAMDLPSGVKVFCMSLLLALSRCPKATSHGSQSGDFRNDEGDCPNRCRKARAKASGES